MGRRPKRRIGKKKKYEWKKVAAQIQITEPNSSNDKEENTEPGVAMAMDYIIDVKTEPFDMDYAVFLNQPDTAQHFGQDNWRHLKDDEEYKQPKNEPKGSTKHKEITEPGVAMTMDFINLKSEPVAVFVNQSNTKQPMEQHLEEHNYTHRKEDGEQNQANSEDSIYKEPCATVTTDVISVKTEPDAMDYAVFLNQSDTELHLEKDTQSPVEIEPNSSVVKEENTEPDVALAMDYIIDVKTEPIDMDYAVFLNQPDTAQHFGQDNWRHLKDDEEYKQPKNEPKGSTKHKEITEPGVAMTMDFINLKSEPVAIFVNQSNTKQPIEQHLEEHNYTHRKEDGEQNQVNSEDSFYKEPGATVTTDFISVKTEPDMDYAVFLNQSDTELHLEKDTHSPVEIDEYSDSDMFFRTCFIGGALWPDVSLPGQKTDLDGDTADEFYVILDRPYKYDNPNINLDKLTKLLYSQLKAAGKVCECADFVYLNSSKFVRFVQMYDGPDYPAVKICVSILKDFSIDIKVNNKPIPPLHMIWTTLPARCYHARNIDHILKTIKQYTVCSGNDDKEIQDLIPVPVGTDDNETLENSYNGYRDLISGESTIRSKRCNLLEQKKSSLFAQKNRCTNCQNYRRTLKKTEHRLKDRLPDSQVNWLISTKNNLWLTDAQKLLKLEQQKGHIIELKRKVNSLSSELKALVCKNEINLKKLETIEMGQMMKESAFNCVDDLETKTSENENTLNNKSLGNSKIIGLSKCVITVDRSSSVLTEKAFQDETKMKNDNLEKRLMTSQSDVGTKIQASPTTNTHVQTEIVFKCKVTGCEYSGGRKSALKSHMNTHLGISGHLCQTCGKSFLLKSNLVRHELSHSDYKITCK